MGAYRRGKKRNGEIKGNLFGSEGEVRSRYKKGGGVGIGRCILRGGGTKPFLFNRFNLFNVDSIAISMNIPFHVATLDWYLLPGCGTLSPARRLPCVVAR